jgi:ureidoglycolate lyase
MIRATKLTAAGFARYGTVLTHPAAGRTAPIQVIGNRRPGVPTTLALLHLAPAPLRIDTLERHRHSGQCFLHLGGAPLLVVVAPDRNGQPDLDRVQAFLADCRQAFDYAPDVWHAGVAAVGGPAMVASLLCRDGSPADVELAPLPAPLEFEIDRET